VSANESRSVGQEVPGHVYDASSELHCFEGAHLEGSGGDVGGQLRQKQKVAHLAQQPHQRRVKVHCQLWQAIMRLDPALSTTANETASSS
jgi:hypothetical protein